MFSQRDRSQGHKNILLGDSAQVGYLHSLAKEPCEGLVNSCKLLSLQRQSGVCRPKENWSQSFSAALSPLKQKNS